VSFTVDIDLTGWDQSLQNIKVAAHDLRPVFRDFKPVLKQHMAEHFERRQAEDGGWPGWSQSYLDRVLQSKGVRLRRTRRGRRLLPGGLTKRGAKRLKNMLGRLKDLGIRVRQSYMEVFSPVEWANAHRLGETVGKGSHLPAREFLWVSGALVNELGRRLVLFLAKAVR